MRRPVCIVALCASLAIVPVLRAEQITAPSITVTAAAATPVVRPTLVPTPQPEFNPTWDQFQFGVITVSLIFSVVLLIATGLKK